MNRRNLLVAGAAVAAAFSSPLVLAQDTGQPIRIIVPYAPCGPIDVTAHALAERVRDSLGTVIIDNKGGAGGNIGADAIAKASPDGLTIGIAATATHAVNPWLYSRMPFDAAKDFVAITQMVRVPNVLVMNAAKAEQLKINTLADLIAYAKARGDEKAAATTAPATRRFLRFIATLLQKSEQPQREASTERCVAGPPTLSESSRIQEVDESLVVPKQPEIHPCTAWPCPPALKPAGRVCRLQR